MVENQLKIDRRLPTVLAALAGALEVRFDPGEVERVLAEAAAHKQLRRRYRFHRSRPLRVVGYVGRSQPDGLWIRLDGNNAAQRTFVEVLQRMEVGRW